MIADLLRESVLIALRNARRSITAIAIIACGGVIMFLSLCYLQDIYRGVRFGGIQALGHLRIVRSTDKGAGNGSQSLQERIIASETLARIMPVVEEVDGFRQSIQELRLLGIVGSEHGSAFVIGFGTEIGKQFGTLSGISVTDGRLLQRGDSGSEAAIISASVEALIDIAVGEWAVMQLQTIDGAINLGDVRVVGYAATAIGGNTILLPLAYAQTLLQTDGVDSIGVLLGGEEYQAAAKARLDAAISEYDLPLEVKRWQELLPFIEQITDFYNTVFGITLAIIVLLSSIAIFAIVSLNIFERTRQLGSLRAIGTTKRELFLLLCGEMATLYGIATLVWIGVGYGIAGVVNRLNLTYTVPFGSMQVPFAFYLHVRFLIIPLVATAISTAAAVAIPVARAVKLNVAEVLRIE